MTLAEELARKVTPLFEREEIRVPRLFGVLKKPESKQLDGRRKPRPKP